MSKEVQKLVERLSKGSCCHERFSSLRDALNYLCWKYPQDYRRNNDRVFYTNLSQALRELETTYPPPPPPRKRRKSADQTSSSSSSSSSLGSDADQASESSDSDDDSLAEKKTGPWFSDIGGMNEAIEELKMNLIFPIRNLPYYCKNGARPVSGILLHGPPGCGKTMLACAIANEAGVPLYQISATEVVSGVSGASEEYVRSLFGKAHKTAPSVIFLDEIDAIGSKRENNQKQMESRIVTQLMTCMDESGSKLGEGGYVLVIGATNRPDTIDPALRRRFEEEIALDLPNESARIQILSVLTRDFVVDASFDLLKIARATPGFVGSDLKTLTKKAANLAMRRDVNRIFPEESRGEMWWRHVLSPEEMEHVVSLTMADFEEAAKIVIPSTRKEGFSAVPSVKWEDIGGLDSLRQLLKMAIVDRIKDPDYYEKSGLDFETGFLLYGPSGCGKTLIAQAVANEAGANFIYVKGPELLNKYVGESERYVRTIFSRARKCSPCIIFFDEIDALTKDRGQGAWVEERLVGQLLIELDGAEQRRGVYVIGATNRPQVMDGALLRPGRLGEHIYVPLPGPKDRGLILKTLAKRKQVDATVDLLELGRSKSCKNFSGADLASLVKKAVQAACLDRGSSSSAEGVIIIKANHFEQALNSVAPSVSKQKRQYYKKLSQHV